MRPTALLDGASDLLARVLRFDAPADGVVSAFFRAQRAYGPRERRALADTTYELLRRRRLYEHLAQAEAGPLSRRLAALAWRGDEGVLRVALSASENDWRDAALAIDVATLPDALRHNLPDWLAAELEGALGDDFWPLIEALGRPAPLDLRVNLLASKREAARAALAAEGVESEPTPYSPWGLRVRGHPSLAAVGPYARGAVEVQDEGSQLLALLVDAHRGEMVADFCAGAGGKTLALGASMRNTGRLYAFDVAGARLAALESRLARSGLSNVYTVQLAHERDERLDRLCGKMDRVLVDAPCSGLGTLRRNPDLKWRQTPEAIAGLRAGQRDILAAAARLVKPGGRLVYSTCSLLTEENEAVADAFEAAARDFEPQDAGELLRRSGVGEAAELVSDGRLRLRPHRHATDGFFAAAWRRR